CTFLRLEGRISDICTHSSFVNPVGTISYVYSTSPSAGIATGSGILTTSSGCGIIHPEALRRGGGAALASPAGAPASVHAASVAICSGVNDGSFTKCPQHGSANQGGMIRRVTLSLIWRAYRRASSYVTSGMGAISPALWHAWQCCCKMGATSL